MFSRKPGVIFLFSVLFVPTAFPTIGLDCLEKLYRVLDSQAGIVGQGVAGEYESTVQKFLFDALSDQHPYWLEHSKRVGEYGAMLARALDLPPGDVERVRQTGVFHDVGKITVPKEILNSDKKLTDAEFAIMKQHLVEGEELLRILGFGEEMLPGVRGHHERWDGKGYPDGVAGEAIPLDARIIAIADAFDAMTSDRAYRRGMPVEKALAIIGSDNGGQWDPVLAKKFVEIMGKKYERSLSPPSQAVPAPHFRMAEPLFPK